MFGLLLDLFVSGFVLVNVLSSFEFNAVWFISFSTEIFDWFTLWISVGMNLRKVTSLGSNLASLTDLKRTETPHSLCCDFRGYKTLKTCWSGGRVQVWIQVWAYPKYYVPYPKNNVPYPKNYVPYPKNYVPYLRHRRVSASQTRRTAGAVFQAEPATESSQSRLLSGVAVPVRRRASPAWYRKS